MGGRDCHLLAVKLINLRCGPIRFMQIAQPKSEPNAIAGSSYLPLGSSGSFYFCLFLSFSSFSHAGHGWFIGKARVEGVQEAAGERNMCNGGIFSMNSALWLDRLATFEAVGRSRVSTLVRRDQSTLRQLRSEWEKKSVGNPLAKLN